MVRKTSELVPFSLNVLALVLMSPASFSAAPVEPPPRSVFDTRDARQNVPASLVGNLAIDRQGLANPALKLTPAQMGQIDRIVAAYVNEEKALRQKYGTAQGGPRSAEAETATRQSRASLNAALRRVLDSSQRKLWDASQAERGLASDGSPVSAKPDANKSTSAR